MAFEGASLSNLNSSGLVNTTNSSTQGVPPSNRVSYFIFYVIVPAVFGLLTIIGLIGNSLVIATIRRTPSLHTTTNFLLLNLAIADLLTLLFGIPNALAVSLGHPSGSTGTYLCVFLTKGNVCGQTAAVSILTIASVAVERYNAILYPLRVGKLLKKENLRYLLVAIWLCGTVITLPMFIKTVYLRHGCVLKWNRKGIVSYIGALIFILSIPTFIICFCYTQVIKDLYFKDTVVPLGVSRQQEIRSKQKIVKMLLLVTVLFVVCFGTFTMIWLLFELRQVPTVGYNAAVQLLYAQSTVNPIIYTVQSTNFRNGLMDILRIRTSGKHNKRNVDEEAGPISRAGGQRQLKRSQTINTSGILFQSNDSLDNRVHP